MVLNTGLVMVAFVAVAIVGSDAGVGSWVQLLASGAAATALLCSLLVVVMRDCLARCSAARKKVSSNRNVKASRLHLSLAERQHNKLQKKATSSQEQIIADLETRSTAVKQRVARLQAQRRAVLARSSGVRMTTVQKGSMMDSLLDQATRFNPRDPELQGCVEDMEKLTGVITSSSANLCEPVFFADAPPPRGDPQSVMRIRVMAVFVAARNVSAGCESHIADLDAAGLWFMRLRDNAANRYYRRCKRDAQAGRLDIAAGVVNNTEADRLFDELAAVIPVSASDAAPPAEPVVLFQNYLHWYRRYLTMAVGNDASHIESFKTAAELFKHYDTDQQSTSLSKLEFRGFFNGVCANGDVLVDSNASQKIFRKIDSNGDGAVSVKEFWSWASSEAVAAEAEVSEIRGRVVREFQRHDESADGLLSMSEFVAFFAALQANEGR